MQTLSISYNVRTLYADSRKVCATRQMKDFEALCQSACESNDPNDFLCDELLPHLINPFTTAFSLAILKNDAAAAEALRPDRVEYPSVEICIRGFLAGYVSG